MAAPLHSAAFLARGLDALALGMEELALGMEELARGREELALGMNELATGLEEPMVEGASRVESTNRYGKPRPRYSIS